MNATNNNTLFFRLKSHQKEFDRYVKFLNITTDGEKFVLYHILSRNWNMIDIILTSIETIKLNDVGYAGFIHVKCKTRNGYYNFSVSDIDGEGWSTDDMFERKRIVSSDLYDKLQK